MSTNRRVSDTSWTEEERLAVLHAFHERCEKALANPIFEHQNIEDPAGGFNFKVNVTFDKATGKQTDAAISINHFELRYYDEAIRLLRPFTLSSEDVFLPKVVQQIKYLVPPENNNELGNIVEWVDQYIGFKKEYAPLFFSTYIANRDGSNEVEGHSNDLALAYIYGESVKVDIDKQRFLKQFNDPNDFPIEMAIASYLVQLARICNVVKSKIDYLEGKGLLPRPER